MLERSGQRCARLGVEEGLDDVGEGKRRPLRMSDEARAEALAKLMCKTGKLDDEEVELLRELWPDVCETHVKALLPREPSATLRRPSPRA